MTFHWLTWLTHTFQWPLHTFYWPLHSLHRLFIDLYHFPWLSIDFYINGYCFPWLLHRHLHFWISYLTLIVRRITVWQRACYTSVSPVKVLMKPPPDFSSANHRPAVSGWTNSQSFVRLHSGARGRAHPEGILPLKPGKSSQRSVCTELWCAPCRSGTSSHRWSL